MKDEGDLANSATMSQIYEEIQRLESRFYDLDQVTCASIEEVHDKIFSLTDRVRVLEKYKEQTQDVLHKLHMVVEGKL